MEQVKTAQVARNNGSVFNVRMNIICLLYIALCVLFYYSFIIIFSSLIKIPWAYFQITGWVSWYVWLAFVFNPLAKWFTNKFQSFCYLFMLFMLIVPGVSFFIAMMSTPLAFGIWNNYTFTSNLAGYAAGIALCSAGTFLVLISFKTIGVEGAAFYYDYMTKERPVLVKKSVYGIVRHPLYIGSLLGSFGFAFLFSDSFPFLFAFINLCFAPIYKFFEEKRLIKIYGEKYKEYVKEVDAFFPMRYLQRLFKKNGRPV